MTPKWRITADGTALPAACAERLISLEISDEAGIASDTLTLTLDNRDLALATPRKGAKLDCWMGYEEAGLIHMGQYVVDEVEASGPPHTLVIKGKAADMRKDLKSQKTRGWDTITIADLVRTVAAEHDLIPVVAPGLGEIVIANLAQTNESDMALLTRVAGTYDAVAKPIAGRLLFVPRGEAKSASGKAMPTVSLTPQDMRTWRATKAERGKYGAVAAQWHNPATGQTETIRIDGDGGDGPLHTLPTRYPDADQARAAAQAKLDALTRGTGTLSADVVPGRPSLGAEGKVVLSGVGDVAGGTWVITRARHLLTKSGGLTTSIEGETPKGAAD